MNIITPDRYPNPTPDDPVAWAEEIGVRVDGHSFDSSLCPQALAPIRSMSLKNHVVQIGTFIKPIQGGGSTAGEVIAAYWARFALGLFVFYWQDADVAKKRWKERILPMLRSAGLTWVEELICEAQFENLRLRLEGVFSETALQSDTIPLIINEEVHQWKEGYLVMSRGRQTRIWNRKALDISNAAKAKTQLHQAFMDGTMREWETVCPVCGIKHAMHFRFNPSKPELGGLRWDSSTRLPDGRPNYNKLEATIRYQFPCMHEIKAGPASRRTLKGDYSAPRNDGAHLSHESWISEAVSYDQIPWLDLVKEWHSAIHALKAGNTEPMFRFVTQRECHFHDPEKDIPFSGQIVINKTLVKSRGGLAGRAARFWFADKQRGYKIKGEMTHYWLVIRDVMPNADSQLVFEGMVQTDADLVARLEEHGCFGVSGAVDCTWDRENILQFCYRNNFNAQTTSAQDRLFFHKDEKAYRIYSEAGPLCKQIAPGFPSKFPCGQRIEKGTLIQMLHPEEPRHWSIHRIGSIKLLFFLRNHQQTVEQNGGTDYIKWEIPGDISDDYKTQIESWEFTTKKNKSTNATEEVCRQRINADHMLMCEAGIACLMAMSGILPLRLAQMGISESIISQPGNVETK